MWQRYCRAIAARLKRGTLQITVEDRRYQFDVSFVLDAETAWVVRASFGRARLVASSSRPVHA